MHDAKPLEIEETAPASGHLLLDLGVEATVLAMQAAERLYNRHVADDVCHFAVDRRGLIGKLVLQRPASGCSPEHDEHDQPSNDDKACSHAPAYGCNEGDGADRRQ